MTCCFDGERRALTSLSISIFGCNALTSSLRRNARTFTTYDISVMVLLSATSINPRHATLPDVSLPRATGSAALSSSPAFHRLGFFVSRSGPRPRLRRRVRSRNWGRIGGAQLSASPTRASADMGIQSTAKRACPCEGPVVGRASFGGWSGFVLSTHHPRE